ncbi:MAG: hypothetical protein LUD18_03890, partial [Lachnospiraceae bacterium]|nr:hypothetical protein [Lachnospiraceae bacterium]
IKPPLQDWQKPYMEAWMCRHPGEKVPGRINISLDAIPDPDITDSARKNDPVLSLCSMAVQAQEAVSAETQAVRDFVEKYLTDGQKLIYQRVLINGESMTSVARDLGIRKQSVYERVQYIRKVFKNNFKKFLSQTDI